MVRLALRILFASNYIVKDEKKLLIDFYIKNLGATLFQIWVATVWIFGNFLATFWHSSEQLFSLSHARDRNTPNCAESFMTS